MTRAELESKHLAELHSLAAQAGVPGYRMLRRAELIERLLEEKPGAGAEAPRRRRRERPGASERPGAGERRGRSEAGPARRAEPRPEPAPPPKPTPREPAAPPEPSGPRRRRRRLWGRRRELRAGDLLLPPVPGRQAIVCAESRVRCTALLRELAAELSGGRGVESVALLIDPGPEELAEWRRDAPQVELIAAGKPRHAEDAIAQALRRADDGAEVVLLIDSLSRFAEEFGGAGKARSLLDAAGTLSVVVALERRER